MLFCYFLGAPNGTHTASTSSKFLRAFVFFVFSLTRCYACLNLTPMGFSPDPQDMPLYMKEIRGGNRETRSYGL
jgi:hypothetical protein